MKYLFIALLLSLSLTSCHKEKKKKHHTVMTNQKSLINRWYGKDHYQRPDSDDDSDPFNKDSDKDAVEIDAGKYYVEERPTPTQKRAQPPANTNVSSQINEEDLTTPETERLQEELDLEASIVNEESDEA